MLLVRTRGLKGPRVYEASGIRSRRRADRHKGTVCLDDTNPDMLNDEITVIGHALTRPWTIVQNYTALPPSSRSGGRSKSATRQRACRDRQDDYFLSSDGLLMPARRIRDRPIYAISNQQR
jgi:hypothetical protein